MLARHPDSGFHYFIVAPNTWGPYMDYFTGYSALARRVPWLSAISTTDYPAVFEANRNDAKILFVLWTTEPAPRPHQCLVTPIYAEAIDDDVSKMLPEHILHWTVFGQYAPQYDAILVHTPNLVAPLNRGMSLPTFLFPAGWSPETMSVPRGKRSTHKIAYWGSFAGRRQILIPLLKHRLGDLLIDATGEFGLQLLSTLSDAAAALYIAHSNVWTFSTWRLWQGLAAKTAHIAEVGDSWPFIAGEHYIPIEHMTTENDLKNISLAGQIMTLSCDEKRLSDIAIACYDTFAEKFTLERCITDYLVPASNILAEQRK